jgi:hypothetical protein
MFFSGKALKDGRHAWAWLMPGEELKRGAFVLFLWKILSVRAPKRARNSEK